MVHYKLIYFDIRGLGETACQLFILADVKFEDHRLTIEEFLMLKPSLPSGHVPTLYVDGFEISQSAAIWRYLARKFGFDGKTPEDHIPPIWFQTVYGEVTKRISRRMVQYKLTYFNARGLAEISRQLFHLAGVEFEDHRIDEQEFAALKPTLPTGQVPILYIDGIPFSQSTAIARYLARKFGFTGKSPEEELLADAIVDTFKDFIESFRKFVVAVLTEESEENIKQIREDVMKPACNTYFAYLNKVLKKSESGFLVGDGLTWADLVVADNLTTLINAEFFNVKQEEQLAAFREKVLETPKLKEWLEKRPVTRF